MMHRFLSRSTLGAGILLTASLALPASAHPGHDDPEAFSRSSAKLAYYQTPNRHHTEIVGGEAKVLGHVELDLATPSDVVVRFSTQLSTVTPEGCPCSVRASLQVDDQEPVVIKRVNLGSVHAMADGKYQVDRQPADGGFVYALPAGKHTVSLIVQRIEGSSETLHAFYTNIQAMPFD